MKKELEVGILYLCIHKKLEEKANMSRCYPKKDFFRMLGETFHVPKNMRVVVMKEMEKKKLIFSDKNENEIRILKVKFDLDKDANKFYEWVGLF